MSSLQPEIIIITGKINSGKSTLLQKLCDGEKKDLVSGIIARGVFENGVKIGFDVIDLSSGVQMPLARINGNFNDGFRVGKFIFSNEAFKFAQKALLNFKPDGIVFLDEVGPMELAGKGYANCLGTLLHSQISRLYITMRSECLEGLKSRFIGERRVKIIATD